MPMSTKMMVMATCYLACLVALSLYVYPAYKDSLIPNAFIHGEELETDPGTVSVPATAKPAISEIGGEASNEPGKEGEEEEEGDSERGTPSIDSGSDAGDVLDAGPKALIAVAEGGAGSTHVSTIHLYSYQSGRLAEIWSVDVAGMALGLSLVDLTWDGSPEIVVSTQPASVGDGGAIRRYGAKSLLIFGNRSGSYEVVFNKTVPQSSSGMNAYRAQKIDYHGSGRELLLSVIPYRFPWLVTRMACSSRRESFRTGSGVTDSGVVMSMEMASLTSSISPKAL